ncbi:H-2 class II histocompatibility antigen, E-S beta chain-like [Kryptolebias marmoratus]|uniref:H-2 class II histocompatibility antigen, E-S beta chain-like n=1 Tax=Kryptolebias marmoratus TaxID=37003 RepID=A0A3Q3BEZ3_KRYMA|nr:H-2 class II histocompatibility antigen, E-S beta chain-like [Kryptolebias marmoratus]
MFAHNFVLSLVFFLISPVFSDQDYYHVSACCTYRGPHFEAIEYIIKLTFNNYIRMEYNSTRGYWIGFTPLAIDEAAKRKSDPNDKWQRKIEKKLVCENNIKYIQSLGNLTAAPTIKLKSAKQPDGGHPAILVCSAYNFYPKQIRLTWLRNREEVSQEVIYEDVTSDGDLYYQIHSHLEYTPTWGEKITCKVEHVSLFEPILVNWDGSFSVGKYICIGAAVFVLSLGLIILTSGFIYYKIKKKRPQWAVVSAMAVLPGSEDSSSPETNLNDK